MDPRSLLLGSFQAAVAAADPGHILPSHLPSPPRGRTLVVGGGKAAASMAVAVEAHWPADAPLSGLVVTRYLHGLPTRRIEVVEASHPLPDGRGEAAALRMLDMSRQLGPDDLLLVLVSGGGSSLLAAPVEGVTLKELRQVTRHFCMLAQAFTTSIPCASISPAYRVASWLRRPKRPTDWR